MARVEIRRVRTVDYHTAGEPFRIVPEPGLHLGGTTVAKRRCFAVSDPAANALRGLLCHEPRGHADMYGGFLVPPDDAGAHLGVLFWHEDGFSTACGHGTIALGAWAVRTGRVPAPVDGTTDVILDVPSGRVTARVHTESGRVRAVDFVSVPSRLIAESLEIETTRTGALQPGEPFTHDSIIGSTFTATASFLFDGSVLPVVTGVAYPTGEHEFIVDPDDPLPPFVLR